MGACAVESERDGGEDSLPSSSLVPPSSILSRITLSVAHAFRVGTGHRVALHPIRNIMKSTLCMVATAVAVAAASPQSADVERCVSHFHCNSLLSRPPSS